MIIEGKKIREKILEELKKEIKGIKKIPFFAASLVGENQSGRKFLELKKKTAEEIGIDFRIYQFPEKISNKELRRKLNQIVKAKNCGGMIIELPLPSHLNTQYILNTIPENKDPDLLSQKSQGAFFANRSKILPPSVEAVKEIFQEYKIEPKGKVVAVFGYGFLVGKPITHWLINQGATLFVINEFTKNPAEFSKNADILISGVGKLGFIKSDMVKEEAIVIDFGFNESDKGFSGDCDFEDVSKKASLITPVPGGVGPIVVASVLRNFLKLISKFEKNAFA